MSIVGAAFATEVGQISTAVIIADWQPWHLLVTIGIFNPAFGSMSLSYCCNTIS
jgi:hypothetical protein